MKQSMLVLVMCIMVIGAAGVAQAKSSYATAFKTKYPSSPLSSLSTTSGQAGNLCTVCHGPSAPPMNSFGTAYSINHAFDAALEAKDSDVDGASNLIEINAGTFPGNAASKPPTGDATKPVVNTFSIPATATSLTVGITGFTASDNVGVTGYLANESATAPLASVAGWTASAPASYTFASAGAKTLYGWAKDAAGNVSLSRNASVTITLPDATKPVVGAFSIPATATSLTVGITSFTASDNVGVTGYLANESATAPLASVAGWTASAPASYTFASAGTKTLYAWAKDAAENVSLGVSAGVDIVLPVSGPQVSLQSPMDGAVLEAGSPVTIVASASAQAGISVVHFYEGTNWIGEVTAEPYEIVWNGLASGEAVLTAQAWDTWGTASTSMPVYVNFVQAGPWAGAVDVGGGWKWASWFGFFVDAGNGWVFHMQHGWTYATGTSPASIWFWSVDMGWTWTSDAVYPFLFRSQDGAWLWYQVDSSAPRWFYNYATVSWESVGAGEPTDSDDVDDSNDSD